MRIREVRRTIERGEVRLTGDLERASGERLEIWFRYPERAADLVADHADPLLPVLLPVCVFAPEPLQVDLPVSPRLWHTLREARAIYNQWFPEATPCAIEGLPPPDVVRTPGAHGTGAFMSLGVDSMYTLAKTERDPRPYIAPLRYLIYMRGLETRLDESAPTDAVEASIRRLAEERGLELLVGETNFRSYFRLDWLRRYFGAGLAGTALSLSRGLSAVLVPSSDSYFEALHPLGGHPLLDPLYSTEATQIVHDGCEAARADKIIYLAEHAPELVGILRVCLENRGGAQNCGRCVKCLRTTLTLALIGRSHLARSLPQRPPDDWEDLLVKSTFSLGRVRTLEQVVALARKVGSPEPLTTALHRTLVRAKRHQRWLERVHAWEGKPAFRWIRRARELRGWVRRWAARRPKR